MGRIQRRQGLVLVYRLKNQVKKNQCGYMPHLKLHLLNYEVARFIKLEEESRWNRFPGYRLIFTSLMLLILCSSRSCCFRRQAQPRLQLTGRSNALHVVNSPAVEPGSLVHLISVYTAAPQSRKNLTKGRTARVCLHLVCVVRVLCGFSWADHGSHTC